MSALRSYAAPTAPGVYRDVEYTRVGDLSLRMDGEVPQQGAGPFPAVILVHGGGWIRGDRAWGVDPLFQPLHEAGFAWFSISYRLATDYIQIGSAVTDVLAAVHYLRDYAAEYNIDPARIAVLGESAGGHLASMAALEEPKAFAAVVGFYTPTDLVELAETSTFIPAQIREAVLNSALAPLLRMHLKSLSPIDRVTPDAPPFLLVHGTSDPVVPKNQSQRFQNRLKQAGVRCDLIAVEGGGHGLRYWNRFERTAHWRSRTIDWLRDTLKVQSVLL